MVVICPQVTAELKQIYLASDPSDDFLAFAYQTAQHV